MMKWLTVANAIFCSLQTSVPSLNLRLSWLLCSCFITGKVGLVFSQMCVFSTEIHNFTLLFLYRSILTWIIVCMKKETWHIAHTAGPPRHLPVPTWDLRKTTAVKRHKTSTQTALSSKRSHRPLRKAGYVSFSYTGRAPVKTEGGKRSFLSEVLFWRFHDSWGWSDSCAYRCIWT